MAGQSVNVDPFRRPVYDVAALLPDKPAVDAVLDDLRLGYTQNIFAVYEEGLRKQEALISVPCSPDRRYEVRNLLLDRGGHAIIYLAPAPQRRSPHLRLPWQTRMGARRRTTSSARVAVASIHDHSQPVPVCLIPASSGRECRCGSR